MSLHPELYRLYEQDELSWHHVGPHHERCSFNLVDLIGYAPINHNDAPPYRCYNVFDWSGPKIEENSNATVPAAKRRGRQWILEWLNSAGRGEIVWRTENSGVHFVANADGLRIASYYHCPDPRPAGVKKTWHVGFRAYFGATYYQPAIASPEQAKEAVEETWRRWLELAKAKLLKQPQ